MNENAEVKSSGTSKEDKPIKKHKKRSKKRKLSDPTVTNISNLLSSTLNLISPKENSSNSKRLSNTSGENICSTKKCEIAEDSIANINKSCPSPDLTDMTPNEGRSKIHSKNAFEFMMESSRKSIGRNSPGKDPDKNLVIPNDENKQKLLARKYIFEKWASIKGDNSFEETNGRDTADKIPERNENKRKSIKKNIKKKIDMTNSKEDHINGSTKHANMKENNLHNFLGIVRNMEPEKMKFLEDDAAEFVSVFQRKRKVVRDNDSEGNDEFEPKANHKKIKVNHSKYKSAKDDISKDTTYTSSTSTNKVSNNTKDPELKLNRPKRVVLKPKKLHRHLKTKQVEPIAIDTDESSNGSIHIAQSDSEVSVRQSLRRSTRSKYNSTVTYLINSDSEDSSSDKKKKKLNTSNDNAVKLAPIFLQNKQKLRINPQVLEARKQFLLSGIPEALKRNIEKQHSFEDIEPNYFPEVSHIQQKRIIENGIDYWNLPNVKLNIVDFNIPLPVMHQLKNGTLNNFNDVKKMQNTLHTPEKIQNLKPILLEIKRNNSSYPVCRSFRLLKQKAGKLQTEVIESEKVHTKRSRARKPKKQKCEGTMEHQNNENNCSTPIMWTEKYKANTGEDLIGNHSSTLELRKWLQSWADISENGSTILKSRDSSDSEFDCDSESRDDVMCPGNAVIIYGPHGSGKTMTIYALCNDLGINVLELNASSKRTGRRLIQELQEATQSHQVRKSENLELTNFFKPNSKHKNTNKTKDTLTRNPKMCLLLVEDVDIVFEQDDGFLGALIQLLLTSKRPIILVANDISSPNLQKIISQYPIIKFSPLTPKVMTIWLQILCLIEGCFIDKQSLSELLEWNEGDVRKTLLQLQFWVQSGGEAFTKMPLNSCEESTINVEEVLPNEDSHSSILGETCENNSENIPVHSNCVSTFLDHSQINLDKIWWNLYKHSIPTVNTSAIENNSKVKVSNLEQFQEHFDTLSVIDRNITRCGKVENGNLSVKNSLLEIRDSIELSEVHTSYSDRNDFIEEWSHVLLSHCISLYPNKTTLDMGLPSTEDRRWGNKQRTSKSKFMEVVPSSCVVDRKAFTLDYYPTLRTISRSEEARFATTQKRKNRFCNYLRVLGLHIGDSVNNTACKVLNPKLDDCKKM
ncbi:hypothetical protein Trydic_g13745 [Trypoxylus dichotomus]